MIDGNNRISGLNRIMELVRTSSTEKSAKTSATGDTPARPQRQSGPRDLDTLKLRLREQVGALDLTTEQGHERARRVILREILAWEFGDGMRDHAEFGSMVETIETALSGNPQTREKLNGLIEEFGSGSR